MMKNVQMKNVVWKEGKYYVSWNLNTGVSSFGKSKKSAIFALQEALDLHLEDVPVSKIHKVERPTLESLILRHA